MVAKKYPRVKGDESPQQVTIFGSCAVQGSLLRPSLMGQKPQGRGGGRGEGGSAGGSELGRGECRSEFFLKCPTL